MKTILYNKMVQLDKKDRKLLYYLSLNARTSHTQLSRKIRLSKNAVKYRIERLKREGIIQQFACVVNLGAAGLETFTILLKFNEDIYENPEIINYFKNHPYANWVITLSGQWDLFVEIICKDFWHVHKLIEEIITRFGQVLNAYKTFFSFSSPLRVEHLVADFYKDLKVEELPRKKRFIKEYKLDKTDKSILNLLNQDSTLPYLRIAQKLNLTIDIVRYRIKNLIEKGVIIKFFPEISLQKLGYTKYLCSIKLRGASLDKLNKIKKQIQTNSNITYAFFDISGFNIVFVCAYKSPEGIDHLSRSLRKEYSEIIDKQEYLIIKEQVLFNLFPKGLLESKN